MKRELDNSAIVYTSCALLYQRRHSPELTFASKSLQILQDAALTAAYHVRINIGSLKDRSFADRCTAEVEKTTAGARLEVEMRGTGMVSALV